MSRDERTRTELQLQDPTQLPDVYDDAPVGLGVLDRDLRYVRVNERLAELQGRSVHEVLGRSVRETLGSPADALEPLLHRVLASGETIRGRVITRVTTSSPRRLLVSLSPSRGRAHEIIGVNLVMEELAIEAVAAEAIADRVRSEEATHRSHREDALRSTEERVRALLDSTAEAIYELDLRGVCIFANAACVRMLGVSTSTDLVGRPMDGNFGPGAHGSRAGPPAWVDEVLREGRRIHVQEGVIRRCDGSSFYGESWAHPVEREGQIVGAVVTFFDVTERRVVQHALAEAKAAAEAANRAKGEFLANMSHEIRTPMTAILGYADVLCGHLSDPDDVSCVETIKRNGTYLIELINDILDLSKIEAGKLEISRQRFSLAALISDVYALVQVRAKERALPLHIEYLGTIPETIESDPIRLRQILINLIGNAIKFTDSGGVRLTIELRPNDECLVFQVIDTGVGISEDVLGRLFRPFTQADSSNTRQYGGTGLGLAISRRLVEMLGGEIWVESELGVGSTFGFTIATGALIGQRLVEPKPVDMRPHDPLVERSRSLAEARILVIDDRTDVRNLVQSYIADAGATVDTAENGEVGLQRVQDELRRGHEYEAIVLDMQMPILDGYQTARRLRDLGYWRPIIALTASAMKGDRDRCLAAGCTEYLSKPVTRVQLIDSLTHHCRSTRAPGAHEPTCDSASSTRVLLVDDNEDALTSMSLLLELNGYPNITAGTGEEAISLAMEHTPAVILLDLGLPDMDGVEVLQQLRSVPALRQTRVIALTGRHASEPRAGAMRFDDYLLKPVDIGVLCKVLAAAMAEAPQAHAP